MRFSAAARFAYSGVGIRKRVDLAGRNFLNAPFNGIRRNSQRFTDDGESSPAQFHGFRGGPKTALKFVQISTGLSISFFDFANDVFPVHDFRLFGLSEYCRNRVIISGDVGQGALWSH